MKISRLLIGIALIFGAIIGGIFLLKAAGVNMEGNGIGIPFFWGFLCGGVGWPLTMAWAGMFDFR